MPRLFFVVLSICALMAAAPAHAQSTADFTVAGVDYDPGVTTFAQSAGYDIGERPVRFGDMITYLRGLADRSDRITVETIGYSHERRPILTFTVTSPANHANLEAIRQTHLDRMEGRAASDAAPMVLWINFGVHGAETSGMEAAVPVLYHYAAGQGPAVERHLEDAVMIFTVIFNPDGHARRIDHVETFWSYADNTDINDAAHELWTEARTNHYWFDLNRQWLLLTQPESQAWIRQWHKWKPMVSADYHEMGSDSPYYFHPGEALRRNPLIPLRARELTARIGERHAAFLDSEARLYSTEEGFDNFYIGKGSTYPQINGSLGILFEAGAARGGAVETERGLVDTADNVRTQFRTALTTIQGSLDLREEITAYQREFFVQNAEQARPGGWVFTADGDPERAARFVRLLNMHDVEVSRLAGDLELDGRTYPASESFFVSMDQGNNRMVRGIFERLTEFDENIFYDVSGWTLPLAYDLDYAAVDRSVRVGARATGDFQPAQAPDRAPYGYVFDWSHTYAPRALNRVQTEELLVRVSMKEVSVETTRGTVQLGRGSIFVPLARQEASRDAIHALMQTIAAEDGVTVHAATSGLSAETGRDLGGRGSFRVVEPPKVVLAYDEGFSRYDVGEVWWTLDYRHRMPVTLVHTDNLGDLDWDDYTHLVMVGGNASIDEGLTEALDDWIGRGGTLIATRDSAQWAEEHLVGDDGDDGDGEAEESGSDEAKDEDEDDAASDDGPERYDFSEMRLRDAEHVIGGSIFATDLDISHPLGFGYSDRDLPVHRNVEFTLERPEDNPYAVPVQYSDAPLLSGYASEARLEEIAGTPSVVTYRMRRGAVILMADNPVFRGTYPGTEKLLMNAIFFSGLIDRPSGDYGPDAPGR
ncbi:MAG: M14 family metallopeptidase [Litorimonas sp.]